MRLSTWNYVSVGLAISGAMILGCDRKSGRTSTESEVSSGANLPAVAPLPDGTANSTTTSGMSATNGSVSVRTMSSEFSNIEIDASWVSIIDGNPRVWSGGMLLVRTPNGPAMISIGASPTKGATDRVALSRVQDSAKLRAYAELAKFMSSKVTSWSKEQTDTVTYREAEKQNTTVDHTASASVKASIQAEAYVNDDKIKAGASENAEASETYKQRTKVDHALAITKELFQKTEFTAQEAEGLIRGATNAGLWRSKDGTMAYSLIVVTKEAMEAAKEFGK